MKKLIFILPIFFLSLFVYGQEDKRRDDLNVKGDILVGGTVDGVDIAVKVDVYDTMLQDSSVIPRQDTDSARIDINDAHRVLTDNPHSVTAAQAGALALGDTIDLATVAILKGDTSTAVGDVATRYYVDNLLDDYIVSTNYEMVLAAMTTDPPLAYKKYQEALLDSFVIEFGADLHLLWVPATSYNGNGEALINWADPGTNDIENGIGGAAATWTALTGWESDGNDSMRTDYNPTTESLNQDDATVGVYVMEDLAAEDNSTIYYLNDGVSGAISFGLNGAAETSSWRLNNSAYQNVGSVTNTSGMWINTRNSSVLVESYRNGSSVDTDGANSSDGISNDNLMFFVFNGTTYWSSNTIAIFFIINSGITDPQATRISSWSNTYMTNLGTNVY